MKLTNAEARDHLRHVGLDSATVLTGASTITIDTEAFEILCRAAGCARTRDLRAAGIQVTVRGPNREIVGVL